MKLALISGTSSGIGKALCENLLETGDYFVIGLSRTKAISHKNYSHIEIDLSDINSLMEFEFPDKNCESYLLVNNSGMVEPVSYVGNANNSLIAKNLSLNLIAPSILSNKFLSTYSNSGKICHIINVSSGAGKYPIDGWSIYNSSKAGLDMFSKVLKEELKIKMVGNVFIHSVAPGIVDTKMQDQIRTSNKQDFSNLEKFIAYHQNGDLADADFVAKKYMEIILHPQRFEDVIFSVKDF